MAEKKAPPIPPETMAKLQAMMKPPQQIKFKEPGRYILPVARSLHSVSLGPDAKDCRIDLELEDALVIQIPLSERAMTALLNAFAAMLSAPAPPPPPAPRGSTH